jgi:hypothetical protein
MQVRDSIRVYDKSDILPHALTPKPSRRGVRDCKPKGGFNSQPTNVLKPPPRRGLGVVLADLSYTPITCMLFAYYLEGTTITGIRECLIISSDTLPRKR